MPVVKISRTRSVRATQVVQKPSYCSKDYQLLKYGGFSFSYLFFMLLYAILVYYGFTTILTEYITNFIILNDLLVINSITLSILFILIIIISYKYGKFSFLYYLTKIITGTVLSNLGLVWFLSNSFTLSYMEILNLFVYLIIVSVLVSILSWVLIRLLIHQKCR